MVGISAVAALQAPKKGTVPSSDVSRGTPDEIGYAIVQCLQIKGYCVITEGLSPEAIRDAVEDVDALEAQDKLRQPNALVQDGLLGEAGSVRIAEMESTDFAENAQAPEGEGLREIDLFMWMLAKAVEPHQDALGFRCTSRSNACVHQTGTPEEETALTDHEASKWMSLFVRQKIVMIVFLGPESGTMALTPYDDEANPVYITTSPGLVMVIRADQLAYRFSTEYGAISTAVSCMFLQDDLLRMHKNVRQQHMQPAAVELESWINARIKQLKDSEEEDTVWDESIPRPFILAMNHHYYKRQQVAVRGICGRFPCSWEAESFFLGLSTGLDPVVEVPLSRWDHTSIYDESPDCWLQDPPKTNCNHACFMEGIELFDNKMFGLSIAEVRGMDPNQRHVLEVSYDALYRSGMRKNTMLNSTCGVYVGTAVSDWNQAERTMDMGIFGATGNSPAITAGRVSFCLGLKGTCMSIDTEAASSLTALYWAAESVEKKGRAPIQEVAVASGVHMVLAKVWWPAHSASGFLCPGGRCFTFDASANGYVRSEGCAAAVVRAFEGKADGGLVGGDDSPVGLISGGSNNNSGRSASLTAPHGPAEQQVLVDACRKAGITPLDVDAVETHGVGTLLGDAVEVSSCGHALRNGELRETLLITSTKSFVGNGVEVAGVTSFMKVLHSIRWGFQPGNLHLRQLNPQLECEDHPVLVSGETLEYRMQSTFCGVSSRGFGGTNVHLLCYGSRDDDLRPPPPTAQGDTRPKISFWPAGGGSLEASARPRQGYSIAGTWNNWSPEAMESECDGRYGFTLTLGEKMWEEFRVFIDGNDRKVLHPQRSAAPKGTMVFGPNTAAEAASSAWLLDARPVVDDSPAQRGEEALADVGSASDPDHRGGEIVQYVTEDQGRPGDQYRIYLHVAGKFRTITWSRLIDP